MTWLVLSECSIIQRVYEWVSESTQLCWLMAGYMRMTYLDVSFPQSARAHWLVSATCPPSFPSTFWYLTADAIMISMIHVDIHHAQGTLCSSFISFDIQYTYIMQWQLSFCFSIRCFFSFSMQQPIMFIQSLSCDISFRFHNKDPLIPLFADGSALIPHSGFLFKTSESDREHVQL